LKAAQYTRKRLTGQRPTAQSSAAG